MSQITINRKYKGAFLLVLLVALVMAAPAAAQNPPPPVVRLEVNPQTAKVGDTVTIAVRLENVTNLFGLQVECQVDPAVMVAAGHVEGDAFGGGNSFYVDQGMKPDGKWLIAATHLQPNPAFTGSGTAFTFQYKLQTAANANFTCSALGVDSKSMPLPLNLVNGTPVVTVTVEPTAAIPTAIVPTAEVTEVVPPAEVTEIAPTPEVTEVVPTAEATEIVPTAEATEVVPPTESTPEVTAVASVSSAIQGVIVNQFAPDSAGVQMQLTSNGNLIQQAVTAADGTFSFADVPTGSYVLLASAPEHLSLAYTITVAGDGTPINLGTQTFMTGDTDNNQTIDLADAVLVSANFDLAVPPAPSVADLNHDGQINISDLVLIGTNFGLKGPIQVK